MMTNTNNTPSVADITWSQIPGAACKWPCGARQPISYDTDAGPAHGLRFRVTSKPYRFVEVELDASDTYTVRYMRIRRSDFERIIIAEVSGVYADMLGEVIYNQVHEVR